MSLAYPQTPGKCLFFECLFFAPDYSVLGLIDIPVIFITLAMSLGDGFRLSGRRKHKSRGRLSLRLTVC